METKYVRVPFNLELAKKITNGDINGRIVTRDDASARIVCWDSEGNQPIIALIKYHDKEYPHSFYQNGLLQDGDCLNGDLMLEIPEYMTFKDGDVLHYDNGIIIFKCMFGDSFGYYCNSYDGCLSFVSICRGTHIAKTIRLATEEEKNQLINELKESKYERAKEYLKRFFDIEQNKECAFKPFDKVLARNDNCLQWGAKLFDRMIDGEYACTDSLVYKYCIPYNEQTAHLLGTTDNWEE